MSGLAAALPLAGPARVGDARAWTGGRDERGLRTLGAEPVELPAIEIVPAPLGPLDDAIARLADYDWLVFTSAWRARLL